MSMFSFDLYSNLLDKKYHFIDENTEDQKGARAAQAYTAIILKLGSI